MEPLELLVEESMPGDYAVYLTPTGEKYIVPEGLDRTLTHEPYGMEAFMLEHYDAFALLYTLLLLAIFAYLIGSFIVYPLYTRVREGLPLFTD